MKELTPFEEKELRDQLEFLYEQLFAIEEEIADIEAQLGDDVVEFVPDGYNPTLDDSDDWDRLDGEEDDLPF